MKLLYATSLSYPSSLANRLQVKATAEALARRLGNNFTLGLSLVGSEIFSCHTRTLGTRSKSPFLAWKYLQLIKKEGFTHVHTREERLAFFLRLYSKLFRVPFRLTYEAHYVAHDFFFKWIARHADGIVSITKGIKEELIGWGISAEKILVAADAVDMNRFAVTPETHNRQALHLPTDKKIIMYTGSFTRYSWKGVDVLLDAVSLADQNWFFVLIGGTHEEITSLQEKYPFSQILLTAHVPQETVARFLTAADVLVIPNKKGERASEYYTSPLKLFEYMASGVPIVASDIASIREVVTDNEATFFTANNPHSLAQSIRTVFANYPNALEKARNAHTKAAREYTWEKRAQNLVEFFNATKN